MNSWSERLRIAILVLWFLLLPSAGIAGHAVSLLIDNAGHEQGQADSPDSIQSVGRLLTDHGFASTIMQNTSQEDLRFAFEQFARTIPTHGIALIYFKGTLLNTGGATDDAVYFLPKAQEPAHTTAVLESRHLGLGEVVGLLQNESGAAIVYLLIDASDYQPTEQTVERHAQLRSSSGIDVNFVNSEFSTTLSKLLVSNVLPPVQAIHSAVHGVDQEAVTSLPETDPLIRPAEVVSAGAHAGEEWVNSLGTVFIWCPARHAPTDKDYAPGFWLGKYETTVREFNLVTFKRPKAGIATQPNHPRDAIRYNDILQYIDELNRRERFFNRLPEDWEYTLPTSEDWEYASLAGTNTRYYFGSEQAPLAAHANFADHSLWQTGEEYFHYARTTVNDGFAQLAPVGSYLANPWGFHDMYGNLWEWTAADNDEELTRSPAARGCSWVSLADYCDSSFTQHFGHEMERNFIGFRLALRRKVQARNSSNLTIKR